MLKDYADCQVICEAEAGTEAVLKATKLKPRLILLDLNIPRLNGIEAARCSMFGPRCDECCYRNPLVNPVIRCSKKSPLLTKQWAEAMIKV